jgi:beta-lactamase regulating signal transducer with metallopeptidase domain
VITPEFVGRILNTVAEGLVVATCVWLALRWFKPLNSGTKFAVWFSTLLAIVGLPFLSQANSVPTVAAHAQVALPSTWAFYLLIVWASIASLLLARLGLSLWHIAKLRRSSSVVDLATLDPTLRTAWLEASSRRVELRVSEKMRVPAAIGFIRPAVIIPTWTLEELPAEELKVILLHELAHLRRWDDWTNLTQKVVKALFFFHPAVWWIEGHLTLEREMACDDVVLAQTTNPKAYAKSLLSLAERVGLGKGIALAQAALGRAHQTTQRIMQILDAGRPKATRVWKPALVLVTAMTAVATMAVPYTPDLVTFEDQKPSNLPMVAVSASHPESSTMGTSVIHAVEAKQRILQPRPNIVARGEPKPIRHRSTVVQANLNAAPAQAPAMLIVMRAVQYDESGISVWTLCVWQVTNSKTAQKQLHPELVVNSL